MKANSTHSYRKALVFFVLAATCCLLRATAADAPINDNFADAIAITNDMSEVYGDNSLATLELGEPDYSAQWQINSLWWTWTATHDGPVRISTFNSAFWAFFHIFTGDSLTNLTLITMGDSRSDSDATINAKAGTTYRIRVVGSNNYGLGLARVAIYPQVPPNDAFENRIVFSGDPASTMGTTVGATAQAKDPAINQQSSGRTVWYEWTAPAFGQLNLGITNFTGPLGFPIFHVGVFGGNQLATLTTLAGGSGGTSLLVTNGQTCIIGVDGSEGNFRLGLNFTQIDLPTNDNFDDRLTVSLGSTVTNDNTRATLEKGEREPVKYMAGATLWYEWTAPVDGLARIVAQGQSFSPAISVYQGTTIKKLKAVPGSAYSAVPNDSIYTINAVAGKTYAISVNGSQPGSRGTFVFGIDLTTVQIISPASNSVISAASPPLFQINAPSAVADGDIQSVAYLAVNVQNQIFPLGTATAAPFSLMPTNLQPGLMTLYAIATNTTGTERLSPAVVVKVRPANDDFSQSQPLSGYKWEASGYTSQATKQSGESSAATVWWDWAAPSSGSMEIEAQLGDENSALRKRKVTVYTGADLKHLKAVRWTKTLNEPAASQYFYFNAVGGVHYYISVAASSANLDPGTWPFLLRGALSSLGFSHPSGESYSEPAYIPIALNISEDPTTVQRIDLYANDGYTNQIIASLTTPPYQMLWSNAPPGNYTLEARVIKTDGTNPPPISTSVSVRPLNDDFANRILLQTNFSWLSHRITGATHESGEPGDANAGTAWWTWTAPADGIIFISDPTGLTSSGVQIYTGTNLATLQKVTLSPDPTLGTSQETHVTNGTAYQFAVTPGSTPNANLQLRFYPPPPNDNFSNRTVMSGSSVTFEGYTAGATRETNEPEESGFLLDRTIWFSWTAPKTGTVTLTQRAGSWVVSALFTGDSLTTLLPALTSGSEVVGGTTYQAVFASYWGDEEHIAFDLDFTPTATNDQFSARTTLTGTNINFTAVNGGGTTEPGEPALPTGANGRTLWWTWTAPANGNVYVGTQTIRHTTMLEGFTGDSLNSLTPLPNGGDDRLYFPAVSNQTYQIRFDATGEATVPVSFVFIPSPANDYFTNATAITGSDISFAGSLRGASSETNDPAIGWNNAWYSWTAPATGSYTVGTSIASVLAFSGSSIFNLTPVGTRNQSDSVIFDAQAGQTYYLEVLTGFLWEPDYDVSGEFHLVLFPGGAPANDNFTNAQLITGTSILLLATNWGATLEVGDPPLVQWRNLRRTLWYQWRAPANGLLQFTNADPSLTPVIGTYNGSYFGHMEGDFNTSVQSNELVSILIDGEYGDGGVYKLGMNFIPNIGTSIVPKTEAPNSALGTSAPPAFTLSAPQMLPHGFGFQISGASGTTFQIESSTNLIDWTTFQTGILTNDTQDIEDTKSPGATRFYRVRPKE